MLNTLYFKIYSTSILICMNKKVNSFKLIQNLYCLFEMIF